MIWRVRVKLFILHTESITLHHFPEEGETHLLELSKLAEKDPEFYKYLQENDKELLNFDPHVTESQSDEDEGDIEQDVGMMPVLTQRILRTWQKALMEVRC